MKSSRRAFAAAAAFFALLWLPCCVWGQSGFRVSAPASAKPGETFHVEVSFHNEGDVGYAQGGLSLDWNLRLADVPIQYPSPQGTSCSQPYHQRMRFEVHATPRAGDVLLCRIPVTVVASAVARTYPISVFGHCAAFETAPLSECSSARLSFLLDGPAPWSQRHLVVVPKEPPQAPTRATLIAFDYTSAGRTPLRMFDSVRPRNVSVAFAPHPLENAFLKSYGQPNAAVEALGRSVRATYGSVAEKQAAAQAAAEDPAVEGVVFSGANYGLRTYPERPRAWEPFALWMVTTVCSQYRWAGYDALTVRVQNGSIQVEVPPPSEPIIDFATCPGGENHLLWNMPGLPQGTYSLNIAIEGGASSEGWSGIALTVQGALPPTRPSEIPASSPAWLGLLALFVMLVAMRLKGSPFRRRLQ